MSRLTRAFGGMFGSVLVAAAFTVAADPSFSGTWKLNLAKSQLGGVVYTIDKTESGMFHYSGGGFEADFDMSGKENVMPSGVAIIGKELSATSWEFTFRMNGRTVSKSVLTVNGDAMSVKSDITGADGRTVQQMSTDTRMSGGPGLTGKWKAGDLKGAAVTLHITMSANEITFTTPETQTTVKGAFDGKEYAVMQAGQATKFTNVFAKVNNGIKVTTLLNGKALAEDIYSLSADGKTLTDESTAMATGEKTKAVFDRQ